MYQFLYKKKEDYINKFTLVLAFFAALLLLAGAIILAPQAINQWKLFAKTLPVKMKVYVVKPSKCDDCFDINKVIDFATTINPKINFKHVIEYTDEDKEAKALIEKYGIEKLPTFVIEGDIERAGFSQIFAPDSINYKDDKLFVYKNINPKYYDIKEEEVRGNFDVMYLVDEKCDECYDIKNHEIALENLMMSPNTTTTFDVASSEGRRVRKLFDIRYVPTILLRGDLSAYENFDSMWEGLGTIESDGTYVFRESGLKIMGPYKDMWTWKILNKELN